MAVTYAIGSAARHPDRLMRLFVALVPPTEAVEHLDEFLEVRRDGRRRSAGPGRPVPRDARLPRRRGGAPARRPGRAARPRRRPAYRRSRPRSPAVVRSRTSARARCSGPGLDLDETGRTELDRLATGCRAAASRAGIAVDGARFRPHLTVARTRSPARGVGAGCGCSTAYAGPRVAGRGRDAGRVAPRRGAARPATPCARGHFPLGAA